MASLRSKLLSLVIRILRKKSSSTAEGTHRRLKWARPRQNYNPPPGINRDFAVRKSEFKGYPVFEWSAHDTKPDLHVLYLHGGGYLFEMTVFHWKFLAALSEELNARFIVPIYPLAPEHNWQDVYTMVMPLYGDIAGEAADGTFVLMGDSAGGGLAAAMALEAQKQGLPAADQLVLLSPWFDLGLTNHAIATIEQNDPWLGIEGAREAGRLYADGHDLKDYRLSPIYGDLAELPPTHIYVGLRDIMSPDCVSFAEIADACGCDIELTVEPEMFHVWMLFDIPEGLRTRKSIIDDLAGTKPAQ
ncbi:alpha/beta hydrolase fold domain-containing protein [Hoeflea sp. TYP-13]|uniref:alpha/beta hydrolase fold domain-containing protein n=1 Tax=Hoeflea sp. TYP-13 TaxID=3230023 RepID=UPI0034C5DEB1